MKKLVLTVFPLTIWLSAAAHAECTYTPHEFFPEKGGGIVVDTHVTDASKCTHNYAEGPGYKFTGSAIELRPEHGTLKKEGPYKYVYRPAEGFKGKDAYMVKVCATKGDLKGCTHIGYVATLE
jgi:hypothetical protein